ncbi:MAG TPA: hypothetical protein VL326_35240 [Kofleriaceae bacterium]|nr:hypothetical protein [Kofleriaceae bacterium]
MGMISLRRLLSKLTVLALSASPAAAAAADVDSSAPADTQCSECDVDLDEDIPIDREHIDPADAAVVLGRGLAQALSEMREIEAVQLSTTWALSQDPVRRAGIAHALEWPFRLMPDRLIIEHLSQDPDPLVQSACRRAAWIRGVEPDNSRGEWRP